MATRVWRGSNKRAIIFCWKRHNKWAGDGEVEYKILWILLCKSKTWNVLIALTWAAGGYLSAADGQVLRRLSAKIRFMCPPGGSG